MSVTTRCGRTAAQHTVWGVEVRHNDSRMGVLQRSPQQVCNQRNMTSMGVRRARRDHTLWAYDQLQPCNVGGGVHNQVTIAHEAMLLLYLMVSWLHQVVSCINEGFGCFKVRGVVELWVRDQRLPVNLGEWQW